MIGLNIAALTEAATSVGIFDGAGLTAHLGRDVTFPASIALLATVVDRLPVSLAAIVDTDVHRKVFCPAHCAVRRSLLP